jgi:hypothetical protein
MVIGMLRRPVVWMLVAVVAAATAFALFWFQPWKLVTDREVRESLPAVETGPAATPTAVASGPTTPGAPTDNRLLASGTFISHEHDTTGTVQLVELADGGRRLVLRGLSTSNGPDLRVWLSDQRVMPGRAGWRVFDDGRWVELGRLKGNKGDQSYAVPADLDLDAYSSVSIWCRRFAVSFGAAELVDRP